MAEQASARVLATASSGTAAATLLPALPGADARDDGRAAFPKSQSRADRDAGEYEALKGPEIERALQRVYAEVAQTVFSLILARVDP